MKIYLIRHGNMAGDPHAACTPPVSGCLSETGLAQAKRLAKALGAIVFDRVFSSPLGRAIQTAQSLKHAEGADVEIRDWLIEWRPAHILNGTDDANFETMCRSAAGLPPEQSWKTPAGEGTLEMAARIIPGWVELLESIGVHAESGGYRLDHSDDERNIAVVAHGGSLGHLLSFVLGVPIGPSPPIAFEETGTAIVALRKQGHVWYPKLEIPPPCSG